MENVELRECPFCGGEAQMILLRRSVDVIKASCTVCGAGTRVFLVDLNSQESRDFSDYRCRKAWNRRRNDGQQ